MNNGEMKTKLTRWSHRADLADDMQSFINGATERINQRFGTRFSAMGAPSDSNPVLADHGETLYFWACCRELSTFIHDFDEAQHYDGMFEAEARRMNIHVRTESWVTDANTLTHIRNEAETAIIEDALDGA